MNTTTAPPPSGAVPASPTDPRRAALGSATPLTTVLGVALIGAIIACTLMGDGVQDTVTLVLLVCVAWVAESFSAFAQRFASMSLTSTLMGVAAVLCGPVGAAALGIIAAGLFLSTWSSRVRAFNAVMTGWVGMTGGVVFSVMTDAGTGRRSWISEHISTLSFPMFVATLVMLLVNALLLSAVIHITAGVPYNVSLRDFGRSSSLLFLIGGLISYLIVILWVGARIGPFTVLVMAPPLLLAQWAYSSLAAEASNVDHAVEALVSALELHRPGSRRHGELVMVIAEEIGNVRGLSDADVQDVRHAARLHHLGTIDPDRPDIITVDRESARSGAGLLDGVDFLSSVRKVIATQSDPLGAPGNTSVTGVLATADALASMLEHRLMELGRDAGVDSTLICECIEAVARRDELDPAARQGMSAAADGTLPEQIIQKLASPSPLGVHEGAVG